MDNVGLLSVTKVFVAGPNIIWHAIFFQSRWSVPVVFAGGSVGNPQHICFELGDSFGGGRWENDKIFPFTRSK